MTTFLLGLTVYLVVVIGFQWLLVGCYCKWLRNSRFVDSQFAPNAAVVLSVRGLDPSLEECLKGLAEQDYPGEYTAYVIVDHPEDGAREQIERLTSRFEKGRFQTTIAEPPSGSCSLKCDRLVQVISQLPESVEAVCLIDADAIPDRKWLSSLVAPLQDETVAAAAGNRWFHPLSVVGGARNSRGNILRYVWNSAAIVQMYVYGIAWGGSLAIRRKSLVETKLLELWSRSLFDDVMIKDHFKSHDLRFVSIPDLLIANQEDVSTSGARDWIKRQLLDARLYHRSWPLVLGHAVTSTLLWVLLLLLVPISVALMDPLNVLWVVGLGLGFYVANFLVLICLELVVSNTINRRREWLGKPRTKWLDWRKAVAIWNTVLFLQFSHLFAAVWATITGRVVWRQCEYRIGGKHKIKIAEYRRYETQSEDDSHSIE